MTKKSRHNVLFAGIQEPCWPRASKNLSTSLPVRLLASPSFYPVV